MNKILDLFDQDFVKEYFTKKILPQYPGFKRISKVAVIPIKQHVWETTYHTVIEYRVHFIGQDGRAHVLPIFATAHSNEPRINVYSVMKFLWKNNFSQGRLTIPRPLYYSNSYRAVFYRGVKGRNLLYYLKTGDVEQAETIVVKTAEWLAKLHRMPADKVRNFNRVNSRIKTTLPGEKKALARVKERYPDNFDIYAKVYRHLISEEEKFFKKSARRWLIHGDAHPENVIKMGRFKIAMIDFADASLSDFARDLGCFIQQLEYMSIKRLPDSETVGRLKRKFLDTYSRKAKTVLTPSLLKRIKLYYNFTALRTVTYFILHSKPDPNRAFSLLKEIHDDIFS